MFFVWQAFGWCSISLRPFPHQMVFLFNPCWYRFLSVCVWVWCRGFWLHNKKGNTDKRKWLQSVSTWRDGHPVFVTTDGLSLRWEIHSIGVNTDNRGCSHEVNITGNICADVCVGVHSCTSLSILSFLRDNWGNKFGLFVWHDPKSWTATDTRWLYSLSAL